MAVLKIIDTDANNIEEFGMCGYKNTQNEGYRLKLDWSKQRFQEGMLCKMLYSDEEGAIGAIEYIPGEFAWRPVEAKDYMFIHCIFILPKKYKEKGNGLKLLDACIRDAQEKEMKGVAVVTRKGSWMAKKDLFMKRGFKIVDKTKPDFELMALKFKETDESPRFLTSENSIPEALQKGLAIFYTYQCPYVHKAITEITEVAEKDYQLNVKLNQASSAKEAQKFPGAYGSFGIAYNGTFIADHPISKTRFKNIMNKIIENEKA